MTELPNTAENVNIVQGFLDETKERISQGVEITFTRKAFEELEELTLSFEISQEDIEDAILNLSIEDYYRGVDPSLQSDFEVCAFSTVIGEDKIVVYLKYGLEVNGIQILLFSNHVPDYPMVRPFKN